MTDGKPDRLSAVVACYRDAPAVPEIPPAVDQVDLHQPVDDPGQGRGGQHHVTSDVAHGVPGTVREK